MTLCQSSSEAFPSLHSSCPYCRALLKSVESLEDSHQAGVEALMKVECLPFSVSCSSWPYTKHYDHYLRF